LEKPAQTSYQIEELIRRRWSPLAFADRPIESWKLCGVLEAARWAASSFNEQPWAFLVATKDKPEDFQKVVDCLVEANQAWAKDAPVLMLSVAKLTFDRNGKDNRHAFHDVGLAVGNLLVQATALGLLVHQMAGFYPDKAREAFGIPEGWDPVAMMALGYYGSIEQLPDNLRQREESPRNRKDLEQFVFSGQWGQTAGFIG